MSDCDDFSIYGDDVSIADSVGSCFEEERKNEEKEKMEKNQISSFDTEDVDTEKDKLKIYEAFKNCVFQDASNDKLYVLRIIKS